MVSGDYDLVKMVSGDYALAKLCTTTEEACPLWQPSAAAELKPLEVSPACCTGP